MEPQQNQNQNQNQNQQQQQNEEGGNKNNTSSGYLCRQSNTRWTPTSEQIRILKELYYNNGVRSPSAEQIQRISARLRQYGKIEGKNVFYWFQNHKARERQKKRLITTTNTNLSDHHHLPNFNPRAHTHFQQTSAWRSSEYPNITPGVSSSCSSSGVLAVYQGGNYGYGSVAMEKSFRDCSISPIDHHSSGGSTGPSFGWVGVDPYSPVPYPFLDTKKPADHETLEHEQEEEESPEIETLPLFPMHGEDGTAKPESDGYYSSGWYRPNNGGAGSRASLELSLNSYMTGRPTGYH